MKKLLLALGLILFTTSGAWAQNTTCANRPLGDSSNACANTRFVQENAGGGGTPGGSDKQVQFNNDGSFGGIANNIAGYSLINNGTGTTPSFQGFQQAGTSAVIRAWQDKARDTINAKDFQVVCNGSTDTTTQLQAAENYRETVGGELVLPPGDCLTSGITINRTTGGGWRGSGNTRLIPTANSVIFMTVTGAVISASSPIPFYVENIHFDANGKTGIRGYVETAPYYTSLRHISVTELQYSVLFTGSSGADQTGFINISDVTQRGSGSWAFISADDTHYIFNVNINNFNQQGTGASTWSGAAQAFLIRRGVNISFSGVYVASLDGAAAGFILQGDTQGVFINNTTIANGTQGIIGQTGTDTLKPAYVYITNTGFDQCSITGMDITGRTWFITNVNSVNGYTTGTVSEAIRVRAASTDIAISNTLIAYSNRSGLVVETGATKIKVNGITAENNNQSAGSFYDVDLQASTYTNVVMYGRNVIGTAGTNATGQRVVDGITSREVSQNNGSVSTTAVTTQEDLMSYTIPASVLKPGQKVILTSWGTFAANTDTKTIRQWFGGNSVADHVASTTGATWWKIVSEIVITGASTQKYSSISNITSSVPSVRGNSLTVTDTASIIVKATGQNGTALAGDITCNGFTVDILN